MEEQNECPKKTARNCTAQLDSHKLSVRSCGDDRAWLVVNQLPYGRCGKGEGAAHFPRPALDFYPISILGRRLICDMYIGRDTGLRSIVPRRNGKATNPIYNGCRYRSVDAAVGVDMILC